MVLNKLNLAEKEFIVSISDAEFWGDRGYFLFITNLGKISIGYVTFPTEADPQFHSDIICLSDLQNKLFGFLSLKSLIESTKSLFRSSQAPGIKSASDSG
jgi:hypothetical protein